MGRNHDPATDRIERGDRVVEWENTEKMITDVTAQLLESLGDDDR